MRWVSVAAVLGAALLPASARPLCRPDRSTTTGLPSTTATTSVETSAIETTVTFVTTFTESGTATATTGFTTITSAATSEAATTTSEAPEITNYIQNGDFEDSPNTDWSLRTSDIKNDPERARSGNKYV